MTKKWPWTKKEYLEWCDTLEKGKLMWRLRGRYKEPKMNIGDRTPSGGFYVGNNLECYQVNAPRDMNWDEANEYCKSLGEEWRLPTKDELNLIYTNLKDLGGFGEGWLWSSSQGNNNLAWVQRFSDGRQGNDGKNNEDAVRACRDFKNEEITLKPELKCPECGSPTYQAYATGFRCGRCGHIWLKKDELKCPKCGKTDIRTDTAWDSYECAGTHGCHHRWSTKKERYCPECGSNRTFKTRNKNYNGKEHWCCGDCLHSFDLEPKTVDVPIDLTDEDFATLAKMAHEQNITFNELCNNILSKQMEKEKENSFSMYVENLRYTVQSSMCVQEMEDKGGWDKVYSEWLERKLYDLEAGK